MTANISNHHLTFGTFLWKVTASHVISYFILGIFASTLLNYEELFTGEHLSCFMKPVDSAWVAAGPLFQFVRGLIFAGCLWIIKDAFLQSRKGWVRLWLVIVGLCILSPTGAAPGSIEGFVYTKIPFLIQIKGYLEVLPQTLLFSLMVFYWMNNPRKAWNVIAVILVVLIALVSVMGIISRAFPEVMSTVNNLIANYA